MTGPRTSYGVLLSSLSSHELERDIRRAIERAADAYGYSGPGGAGMHIDELERLLLERARRRGLPVPSHAPRA